MTRHHETKSPSSFPSLELCPCFKSGEVGEAANRGAIQHEVLAALLSGKPAPDNGIRPDEMDHVLWAKNEIELGVKASGWQSPIEIEKEITVYGKDIFEEITFGTVDVGFGSTIIDYKSGRKRNYAPQMMCYALGWMQKYNLPEIHVMELYGKLRDKERYWVTRAEAEEMVFRVSKSIDDPENKPKKNQYCTWCEKESTCSEIIEPVGLVVGDATDFKALTKKPLNTLTTVEIDKLLPIANIAAKWSKAIQEKAKEVLLAGQKLDHYELKSTMGSRFVSDLKGLKKIAKLSYQELLEVCSITIGNLEKLVLKKKKDKKVAESFIAVELASVIGFKAGSVSIAEKKKAAGAEDCD